VLHQVGVSFDLYYDARKHKIKTLQINYPNKIRRTIQIIKLFICRFLQSFVPSSHVSLHWSPLHLTLQPRCQSRCTVRDRLGAMQQEILGIIFAGVTSLVF
jgi:hypothetical protein